MLAFGIWTNEVWRPLVPACARTDPATCLQPNTPDLYWVPLRVNQKTGTSAPFTVPGTSFGLQWTVTVPAGGCDFSLLLGTAGGKLAPSLLFPRHFDTAGVYSGPGGYADVGPGTFFVQEDRSHPGDCTGPYTLSFAPLP